MLTQDLHHGVALAGFDLQQHAQLLIEQGLQGEFFTPGAHLSRPVFAVTHFGPAVANTVALGDEHVHVQRYADLPGKGHLASGGKQAAVAAVMVSQQFAFGTQLVHRMDQVHQILRVVQIRHDIAHLIQGLSQDAARHAVLATAQIDQNQRGVGFVAVELRCEGAAHIGQRDKCADDQADGAGDFFGFR